MHVQVAGDMRLADVLGIDFMEPVLLGEGFADIVIHAVDGPLGIGIFLIFQSLSRKIVWRTYQSSLR